MVGWLEVCHGDVLPAAEIRSNGAGKSTTLRIIMGLVHQDAGDVTVLGHPMPTDQIAAI